MESLQVRTGQISLNILDDNGESKGIFRFNPADIESAKRIYGLRDEFDRKQVEFEARVKELEKSEKEGEALVAERFEILTEIVDYFEELIDECFGKGSSKLLFGEAKTLSMFDDFFTGIIPYYTEAGKQRTAKYAKPRAKKA